MEDIYIMKITMNYSTNFKKVYTTLHYKPHKKSEDFSLLRITKDIKIYPLGTMNECTKFHENPSNSCSDISVNIKNLLVLLQEKSSENKAGRIHPLRTMNVCTKCHDNPSDSC